MAIDEFIFNGRMFGDCLYEVCDGYRLGGRVEGAGDEDDPVLVTVRLGR